MIIIVITKMATIVIITIITSPITTMIIMVLKIIMIMPKACELITNDNRTTRMITINRKRTMTSRTNEAYN